MNKIIWIIASLLKHCERLYIRALSPILPFHKSLFTAPCKRWTLKPAQYLPYKVTWSDFTIIDINYKESGNNHILKLKFQKNIRCILNNGVFAVCVGRWSLAIVFIKLQFISSCWCWFYCTSRNSCWIWYCHAYLSQ